MKARTLIILLLLVSFFPVCGAKSDTAVKAPLYSVGDYWNYQFTDQGVESTRNMTITSLSTTFEGQTCIEEKYSYPSQGYLAIRRDYYRVSDMAEVGTVINYTSVKVGTEMVNEREVYDPPLTSHHFPMQVGDQWSSQSVLNDYIQIPPFKEVSHTVINIDVSYEVSMMKEKTTVDAGTFDTLRMDGRSYNNTILDQYWYAPKVGNYINASISSTQEKYELLSYSYKNAPKDGSTTNDGGMLSGNLSYILVFVIIIVVVIIVVMLVSRKKRKVQIAQPLGSLQQLAQQAYDPAAQDQYAGQDDQPSQEPVQYPQQPPQY